MPTIPEVVPAPSLVAATCAVGGRIQPFSSPASLPRDEVDCSTLWMELQALAAGPIVIKCIVELLFCSTSMRRRP